MVIADEVSGGDWMLKFKFRHSNALHSSRMGRLPHSYWRFVHLLKQSSGRWEVGGQLAS